MLKDKRIIIAGGLVLLGVFLYFHFQGDEARIRKQFRRLSDWATKWPDDERAALVIRSNKIRMLFTQSVSLQVGDDRIAGHYTQRDIGSLALNTLTHYVSTRLTFDNLEIEVSAPDTAKVRFTVRFAANEPDGAEIDDYRELACVLRKVEGEWLFESFDVAEPVEK